MFNLLLIYLATPWPAIRSSCEQYRIQRNFHLIAVYCSAMEVSILSQLQRHSNLTLDSTGLLRDVFYILTTASGLQAIFCIVIFYKACPY